MKSLIASIKFLLFFSIVLGLIYPMLLFVIGQMIFPSAANGSIIMRGGKVIGSKLIAQKFTDDKYFHPRPSSIDFNPSPSGGSNLSPTSAQLKTDFVLRKKIFIEKNNLLKDDVVPAEMLFASGSGVDPQISKQSALFQADRIARIREYDSNKKAKLIEMIERLSEKRIFNLAGEEIINVLELNLQLDKMQNER